MGVSTDAILFFGYCWDEEGERLFADDDGEWQDALLRKRGEKNPWDDYPNEAIRALPYPEQQAAGKKWTTENRAAIDAWCEKKKAVEAEFGVEVGYHCSGDCPMPYIYAKKITARRGCPVEVEPTTLYAEAGWAQSLGRFLAEFGIEPPHDAPRWWLVSNWS